MIHSEKLISAKNYYATPGKKIILKDWDTDYRGKGLNKKEATQLLEEGRLHLAEMQDKLYAHNQYGVLIILQAMDAAGKDGAVKHIMSGFNPLGVKVYSFKAPNAMELDHDYIWRHYIALPARGEISIHNRSHYENVLITRVHPEFVMNERIPGVDEVEKLDEVFWNKRYNQINQMEKSLSENGIVILKFFLHLSKKEQKKRFLERIDDPAKNWKFSFSDLKERGYWDEYQTVFGEVISATSQEHAPWYIIPADDKWFSRLAIASIIYKKFESLNLHYPVVSQFQKEELKKAKMALLSENSSQTNKKEKKEKKKKK